MSSRGVPPHAVRVWHVHEQGPRQLHAVLEAMGVEPSAAVAEGRVWIGKLRATQATLELAVGAQVEVHAARLFVDEPYVLERVDGFVAAFKPAAWATEPERAGLASLTEKLEAALGTPLHAVSRLDVGVSGVVLLSEGRAAHQRAVELKSAHAIRRRYLAVAERAPETERGVWSTPLSNKPASTQFSLVALASEHLLPDGRRTRPALLTLEPVTGRKHQLRLHSAEHGLPLLGDRAHGGVRRLTSETGAVREIPRILLHSARLELETRTGEAWIVFAPPPSDFVDTWCSLGGRAEDLTRAVDAA